LVGGTLNIIKPNHGNIFRNLPADLPQGANRTMAEMSLRANSIVFQRTDVSELKHLSLHKSDMMVAQMDQVFHSDLRRP